MTNPAIPSHASPGSSRGRLVIALAVIAVIFACIGILLVRNAKTGGTYLSENKPFAAKGQYASLHVELSGGIVDSDGNLMFTFAKPFEPGKPQSISVKFTNTGNVDEDAYVRFTDATSLSTLNNAGTYAEAHLAVGSKHIFDSANLNDHAGSCGPFSPSGCWPMLDKYLLTAGNPLKPGQTRTLTFTYMVAAKSTGNPPAGTAWNQYPVPAGKWSPTNHDGQWTVVPGDTGDGLPGAIWAGQVGQTP